MEVSVVLNGLQISLRCLFQETVGLTSSGSPKPSVDPMDRAQVAEQHSLHRKIRAPRQHAVHPSPSLRDASPSQGPIRAPRQRPNRGPTHRRANRDPNRHPNPIHRRANRRTQGSAPGWLRSGRLRQQSQARFCVTWRSPQSDCFWFRRLSKGRHVVSQQYSQRHGCCIGLWSNISRSKVDFTMRRTTRKKFAGRFT
jgi:hypothetical protein